MTTLPVILSQRPMAVESYGPDQDGLPDSAGVRLLVDTGLARLAICFVTPQAVDELITTLQIHRANVWGPKNTISTEVQNAF
jgi:hypothetical protein